MNRAMRRAPDERGMTAVEIAVTFAIVGSLLAVAVPAFVRDLHSSKLTEPVEGIKTIAESATAYARAHDVPHAYPESAPLTPAVVPKGVRLVDPPGTWDRRWATLGFRPTPEGIPHAFAFEFDSVNGPARSTFRAVAHGDLDGDGALSTFEVTGWDTAPDGPVLDPGMYVEAELE